MNPSHTIVIAASNKDKTKAEYRSLRMSCLRQRCWIRSLDTVYNPLDGSAPTWVALFRPERTSHPLKWYFEYSINIVDVHVSFVFNSNPRGTDSSARRLENLSANSPAVSPNPL